ncbi:MAG: hypothetical protein WC087_02405 [Candidatus Paceibacterota bacterium]
MKKKAPSKGKRYPDLVSQNKALCKAISLLPTTTKSSVPAIYIKSLPMVIGVMTIIALIILPTSRNFFSEISSNTFKNFSYKNEELKSHLIFSLRAGVTAYSDQIKKNIKILPIDTEIEPQLYGGRVEPSVDRAVLAEGLHSMTASLSDGFSKIKPDSF